MLTIEFLHCSYCAFQKDSLRLPISDRASSESAVDRSHRYGGAHSAQPQNCTPPCESKFALTRGGILCGHALEAPKTQ